MESFYLKKGQGGVELNAFGLKLNINPRQLIQTMMNQNSQKMMDSMIEQRYINAIKEFGAWHDQNYRQDENKDLIKECERLDEKYKCEEHVDAIQDIADIIRYLIPLHSDGEIFIGPQLYEILDKSYSFWKYKHFLWI